MAKRVVVVGGGVIGLSCASYLEAAGHEVIVLDRGQPESERCSSGNSGLVVPSHFIPLAAPGMVTYGLRQMFNPRSPFRIKPRLSAELIAWLFQFRKAATRKQAEAAGPVLRDLNLLSRSLYLRLSAERGFNLEQRGLLMVCREPRSLREEEHVAERARRLGLQAEVLHGDDIRRVDRTANYQAAGAVWFPQDCSLDPAVFCSNLRSTVADLRNGVEVHGFVRSGTTVCGVRTASGAIEADAIVLAGGIWSGVLAKELGANLMMQAGKGYSMTLEGPQSVQVPSILVEGRVAVTPLGGRLRVGGTMELAGIDDAVDRRRIDGIIDTFRLYLPDYETERFSGLPVWKGLRPCPPDGLPYIGPLGAHANVFAATGHAMMGLSLAPATGYLIAQHVSGQPPEIDSSLLSPNRF